MKSGGVVEGLDVIEDRGAGLGMSGEALMIDQFVFEAAPEGLDEGVIVAVALATHRSDEAVLGQDLSVGCAGKLGSTVRVEDKSSRGATLAESHAQGGDDQWGIEDLAHGPADYSPGKEIQDRE